MQATSKTKDRTKIRQAILEKAGEMLLEEGVHGISMRKLSKLVGTSTMVLYNCFENKQEILNELYLEGFAQLRQQLEAVPQGDDPSAYLVALGRAYRSAALANEPAYYLMQSRSLPGFTVPRESLEKSRESFAVLEHAVQRCMDAGIMTGGDATGTAQILWATIHGLISLQLFGHFRDDAEADARFEHALNMMRHGLSMSQPSPQEADQ